MSEETTSENFEFFKLMDLSTTSVATIQLDQQQTVLSNHDNDDKDGQSDSDRDGAEEVFTLKII